MTDSKQLIATAFTKAFNKHFYNELVLGKLAHSEMKNNINKGDEVDVTMPGLVTLFDYDGGDLPNAENATLSTCKVKIDRGKAFHFELSEMEEKMLKASSSNADAQIELAKDYTNDAIKQFAAAVDTAYAGAYASYRKAYDAAYAQYNVWKNQEVSNLANLKIVIPETLVSIYNEISGLGK